MTNKIIEEAKLQPSCPLTALVPLPQPLGGEEIAEEPSTGQSVYRQRVYGSVRVRLSARYFGFET
jgi:hypothetical protein